MAHKPRHMSPEVRRVIERAMGLMGEHPNVERVSDPRPDEERGRIDITVELRLGLPSSWMAAGESPHGVYAIEPVNFSFPYNYPINAPLVTLRDNFDRSLAHVQPGPLDGPVAPCLVAGDLHEFLHAHGLMAIVDQLVDWLEKAALEQLIDPSQGWEPMRRDGLVDWIIADGDGVRRLVGRQEHYTFLPFHYLKVSSSTPLDYARKDSILYGAVGTKRIAIPKHKFGEILWTQRPHKGLTMGGSIAVVVTPGKLPSGELYRADRYTPETITNLRELKERAKEYGCGHSLHNALSYLEQCAHHWRGPDFPVAVILCARRPYLLIDTTSDIELIPYLMEAQTPNFLPEGDSTPIYPAAHRHAITATLLQRFSGEPAVPEQRHLTLVGCGSLGSKIALHLARSGAAPAVVIDKLAMSPHHAARHALVPPAQDIQLAWLGPKAEALALAIEGLGQSTKAVHADVIQAVQSKADCQRFFPKSTWAVLNTTASLRVREALASLAPDYVSAPIIETSLFAHGKVGLITVEGPHRNPHSMDLIATTYELFRTNEQLREDVFDARLAWQDVGQGCGSATMRVSDTRISLFAAAMTEYITHMRLTGLPDDGGRIVIGMVSDDGMSLNWSRTTVLPVHVIKPDNAQEWTVRVAEQVHRKILDACMAYPQLETGGIIVGRISESQRAFLVTDILPAPADTQRSARAFVLGIQDVRPMLEAYMESCQYALYCLGTWHRHLNTTGPSERDRETATLLAQSRMTPSLLLIKTEAGYRALVAAQ